MLVPLLLAALAATPVPAVCVSTDAPAVSDSPALAKASARVADSTLATLYAGGVDFETFLASAVARRAMWVKHWEEGRVPADAVADLRALRGRWRILVVAVDSCSDSANSIPYLARLVAQVPALEMRIVQPGSAKSVMEAHRTPDGRPATPTVVILDPEGREIGCWIERPSALQALAMAARAAGSIDAFQQDKQRWYDEDAGASTVREVAAVLRAAAAGSPRCAVGPLP